MEIQINILKSKDISKLREKWIKLQNYRDPLFNESPSLGAKIERPTLDHQHWGNGNCRAVLDYNSNQALGKIESMWKRFGYKYGREGLPAFLRRVAIYLEEDYSKNPVHPKHIQTLKKRFKRMSYVNQKKLLKTQGLKVGYDKGHNFKLYSEYFKKNILKF